MTDGDNGGPNLRAIVAAVLALALLVGIGLFLSHSLRQTGQLQDCVASGRTNCAPIGGR
jgi:hypothetical protein